MIRKLITSLLCVLAAASIAAAGTSVGVDIATPNARVQVGTNSAPPPPPVVVVEKERVVVKEHKDNGKHKGQHKKHKKHKGEGEHHH